MKLTGEKVPMTDEDKKWLLKIYKMRKDSLFPSGIIRLFLVLTLFLFWGSVVVAYGHDILSSFALPLWAGVVFGNIPTEIMIYAIISGLLGWASYKYTIEIFKIESCDEFKYVAKFDVVRKQYFPVVDEYMIYIPELNERGLEVTPEDYEGCEEDGEFQMYVTSRTNTVLYPSYPASTKLFYIGPLRNSWGYRD